ncbi:MAG: hypothetical protein F2796_07475, partial [Actinobacteria bacterium]|nr:hypothetical protein [Actinomycetota bacterium]
AAAVGGAIACGIAREEIEQRLVGAGPPPGRMELLERPDGSRLILDYAHNEEGVRATLAALREQVPQGGRLIAVVGARKRHIGSLAYGLGRGAATYADVVVVTGSARFLDGADAHANPHAVRGAGDRAIAVDDRAEAIAHALAIAGPQDLVAVLGGGATQEVPRDDRIRVLRSDREVLGDLGL